MSMYPPGDTGGEDRSRKTSLLSVPWLQSADAWQPGQVVGGRYKLVQTLGKGGVGEVLLAEDLFLRRKVALKTLKQNLAGDPEALDHFRQEVAMAHTVAHEGLTRTFDMGQDDGVVYISMEYLEGESLAKRVQRERRLPVDLVRRIGLRVAAAVHAAHRAGVIHRDLKPANIQLTPDRGPVVMDFGVAAGANQQSRAVVTEGRSELVRPSTSREGSPAYMAPEQWRGKEQGPATDIYAFGIILYEALTGTCPFLATTTAAMMHAHCDEPPPSVRAIRPDVPADLDRLITHCLAKEPAKRPASMYEVARRLAPRPVGSYLLTAVLALAVAFAVLAAGLVIWKSASALLLREMRPAVQRLAMLAAQRVPVEDLDRVRGEADIDTPAFRRVLKEFRRLREENEEVEYIYSLRKKEAATAWEFVVDLNYADADANGNGSIEEDEEGSPPGLEYDGSEFPALQRTYAENWPQADDRFASDQWGLLLSGYAPVAGKSKDFYLVGVDVGNAPLVRLRNTLAAVVFTLALAGAGTVVFLRRRRAELPGF